MDSQRDFILWGCGGHAIVLSEIINASGGRVIALFDNHDRVTVLPDVPVFVGEDGFKTWASSHGCLADVFGFVAIGGSLGRTRLLIQKTFHANGISCSVLIHPSASISSSAVIGLGSQVLASSNIAAKVHIGESCIVNHMASVDHECIVGNGVHIAPGAILCGCVTVEDGAFIGAGAVILPRLTIGADAVVGAGAVVTRNVPARAMVVGNPAKQLS